MMWKVLDSILIVIWWLGKADKGDIYARLPLIYKSLVGEMVRWREE